MELAEHAIRRVSTPTSLPATEGQASGFQNLGYDLRQVLGPESNGRRKRGRPPPGRDMVDGLPGNQGLKPS